MGSVRHCLVTGANGFIGQRLVDLLLAQGYQVRAVCRRQPVTIPRAVEVISADLHSAALCLDSLLEGIDTVFHLANTAHVSAFAGCYQADAEATARLVAAASRAGVQRLVFASSTKAMADQGNIVADESFLAWPLEQQDPYGYWKRMAEERLLAGSVDLPHVAILRPVLVYGPGVKGNLRWMINAVRRGWFPALPCTGATRSMVSVGDVARALLLLAMHPSANRQVFIAEDGQAYSAADLQDAIRLAFGRPPPAFRWPAWSFRLAGRVGDAARLLWPSCPLCSAAVHSLLDPATYSADRLRGLGWEATSTFFKDLPGILAACQGRDE